MSTPTSQLVFACYSKACAPPPAGKGGSTKGGKAAGGSGRKAEHAALIKQVKSGKKLLVSKPWTDPRDRASRQKASRDYNPKR